MRTTGRRGLTALAAALVAVAVALGASAGVSSPGSSRTDADEDRTEASGLPLTDGYRFVSSPDFMNADVADLSRLQRYDRRTPNSWNASYARAVDTVMSGFAAERPDDVLVAGDLVNGHWGLDTDRSGVFGPVRTASQQRAAIRRAAATYYTAWRALFDDRDLDVHVAVGDHEIGDNDWSGNRRSRFKRSNLELFKNEFADHALHPSRYSQRPHGPARRTAYATYLDPDVLLVTVDVFSRSRGDVVPQLDRQQLQWLDRVLGGARRSGTEWIVVQGHTPVLSPVRTTSSSGLMYRGGGRSPFWRALERHGVDLYLCGEVHDITARTLGGVTQISHGGMFGHASRAGKGGTNYLVGDVDGDEMVLTSKRWRVSDADGGRRLWQTTSKGRPPIDKTLGELEDVGRMVLGPDGVEERGGLLGPYEPSGRNG